MVFTTTYKNRTKVDFLCNIDKMGPLSYVTFVSSSTARHTMAYSCLSVILAYLLTGPSSIFTNASRNDYQ